jgi:hypothetical protein
MNFAKGFWHANDFALLCCGVATVARCRRRVCRIARRPLRHRVSAQDTTAEAYRDRRARRCQRSAPAGPLVPCVR